MNDHEFVKRLIEHIEFCCENDMNCNPPDDLAKAIIEWQDWNRAENDNPRNN